MQPAPTPATTLSGTLAGAPSSPDGMWSTIQRCPSLNDLKSKLSTLSTFAEVEAVVDPSSSGCYSGSQDPYDLLLMGGFPSARPAILFGWWPHSGDWNQKELVQCSTQCLPAVRPVDLVALPLVPEVCELWEAWRREHGLRQDHAVWYEPHLGENAIDDPASEVCHKVLSLADAACRNLLQTSQPGRLHFYPFRVTVDAAAEAARKGFPVIGDLEGRCPVPPSQDMAWKHPHISGAGGDNIPSFSDALPADLNGVRGLKGYVAKNYQDLQEGWRRLQRECPTGTRFLLRISEGSSCGRAIADVQPGDLEAVEFQPGVTSVVLEEMLTGAGHAQVHTLNMIGNIPLGTLADEDFSCLCVEASQQINKEWGLVGPWSLDFAVDLAGTLVIVGVSVGCPSSSFAVQLWASRARHPVAVLTGSWDTPSQGAPSIEPVMEALSCADLLWDGDEGIVVYQHAPGTASAFVVASSFGDEAVEVLRTRLSKTMLESFGIAL
uniref:Uncharacterized protein n=1 Tax=Pyrodinium bahamense TaxID=73915 RepID=A0A7R9ZVE2_9DINO|mmetsp:Transcript_10524/g.29259  ORF Transcript_10524/g.29259 Transcript_10524/m.29259 type:complete len:493 (+) Transcript_10524:53-1531(+)